MSTLADQLAPEHDLRVILVGRTGIEAALRRDPRVELVRVRSGLDAVGEVASPIDEESPGRSVVVLGPETLGRGDTGALAGALRKVDLEVRVVGVAVWNGPGTLSEEDARRRGLDAWIAADADAGALRALFGPAGGVNGQPEAWDAGGAGAEPGEAEEDAIALVEEDDGGLGVASGAHGAEAGGVGGVDDVADVMEDAGERAVWEEPEGFAAAPETGFDAEPEEAEPEHAANPGYGRELEREPERDLGEAEGLAAVEDEGGAWGREADDEHRVPSERGVRESAFGEAVSGGPEPDERDLQVGGPRPETVESGELPLPGAYGGRVASEPSSGREDRPVTWTALEATEDLAILRVLLEGGEVLEECLRRVRRRLAPHEVSFRRAGEGEPEAGGDRAAAAVRHKGRAFGWLVGPAVLRRDLEVLGDWLAHYLALQEQHAQMRTAAFTDPLTGAWNRRYFEGFLSTAIAQARQRRNSLTLLLFDIDDFKRYNDAYGHEAGDEILCETVRLLRSVIRPTDRVCRIGGDEFAVAFYEPEGPRDPGSRHPASIVDVVRRFQKQINEHRFPKLREEAEGCLTISGGLATFPWDGLDMRSLIRRADRLVLDSKRQGKNKICIGAGVSRGGGGGPGGSHGG